MQDRDRLVLAGATIDASDTPTFLAKLESIVGSKQFHSRPDRTRPYRSSYRGGSGEAIAVVRPRSLVEQWRVVAASLQANRAIIMQAANTSLTGGATPALDGYDRQVVIINTMHLSDIHIIRDGRQVICLPGATLAGLERALARIGREPHSVIGSSCVGASVIGGVCNNSGGALLQRGPAFTQMALFARVDEGGELSLVNHLGVRLGDRPELILAKLDAGAFVEADIDDVVDLKCSDQDYVHRIRDVTARSPARYNADPRRLYEASGCAGKLTVFAVRLDTFEKEKSSRVLYVGVHKEKELARIRRHVLSNFEHLPIAAEYIHRDAFAIAETYGKDMFLAIRLFGAGVAVALNKLKTKVESVARRMGLSGLSADRWLMRCAALLPGHLPHRIRAYHAQFEHHLLLRVSASGANEAERYLSSIFPSADGDYFRCSEREAADAFLHRFVVAGAAVRYCDIHREQIEGLVALDVALDRNATDWFERLPSGVATRIEKVLYYGHFFCHVFHQDYVVRKNCDIDELKRDLLQVCDSRRATYPAEHNVGHQYAAAPALERFYRELDPRNQLNPGIGQTSKRLHWQ